MLDKLRKQMANYLSEHQIGVISTKDGNVMPVRYQNTGLELDCVLPRWSEMVYRVEQDPHVTLVIMSDENSGAVRWLEYAGVATLLAHPKWQKLLPGQSGNTDPAELYVGIRVKPERLDLVDHAVGRGVRETLELG